jgi:hypothetical protein
VWLELVQLVPVISLAIPFITRGEVDLARAAPGFLIAAALFVIVTGLVVVKGGVLNPILLGTGAWLILGALAFNVSLDSLASSIAETQAFTLFLVVCVVGLIATFASSEGFIGHRSDDATWIRRASLALLALAVGAAAWSYRFHTDVRLGGGLPFIVLNVARRLLIRTKSRVESVT